MALRPHPSRPQVASRRQATAAGIVLAAATLAAAAALALAGHSLWEALATPGEGEAERVAAARPSSAGPSAGPTAAPPAAEWPALFGVPPPEPTAPPPTQKAVDYVLKGIVASEAAQWAILSDSEGDHLVQEGDTLSGGAEVEAIGEEGVWLRRDGERALVAFTDDAPVRMASVALAPEGEPGAGPRRQEVRTQSLTPIELRDLILKAEAERVAKGLVPVTREDDDAPSGDRRPRATFGVEVE